MTATEKQLAEFGEYAARVQECGEVPADGILLSGPLADAFAAFKAAAGVLHAVTQKARNDIELAQQKYREALAEFTRLSVAPEG